MALSPELQQYLLRTQAGTPGPRPPAPPEPRPAPPAPAFDFGAFAHRLAEALLVVPAALKSPAAGHVYAVLAFEAYKTGGDTCRISAAALATHTGLSYATVVRAVKHLERQRYLVVRSRGTSTPNTYQVLPHPDPRAVAPHLPAAWRPARAPLVLAVDTLTPDDHETVEIAYRALPPSERDGIHQRAAALMQAAGWAAPLDAAPDDVLRFRWQATFELQVGVSKREEMLARAAVEDQEP
jgi:hypothetical protein